MRSAVVVAVVDMVEEGRAEVELKGTVAAVAMAAEDKAKGMAADTRGLAMAVMAAAVMGMGATLMAVQGIGMGLATAGMVQASAWGTD